MSSLKISGFGGMVPSIDDRLLPEKAGALSRNTWLYSGALTGLPSPKSLHVCVIGSTGKAYRIPQSYTDAGNLDNSYWMEFQNPFTDVIRAPIVADTFDRYYWATTSDVPRYNTKYRIAYGLTVRSSVVTATAATDLINWTAHGLNAKDTVKFTTTTTLPAPLVVGTVYYVSSSGLSSNSFKLSTTYANAVAGTNIDITDAGTGTHTATTATQPAWKLGITTPVSAPGVSPTGGSAPNVTRAYVTTWVSEYGEEGAPSPPTTATNKSDATWAITPVAPASVDLGVDRNLTKVRIYRTITSTAGVATFFLVVELDISTTSYNDTLSDTTVASNNQLASTTWIPPPTDLLGWVLMPNGMLVGWRSNELWFSEPFRPHAWPATYSQAVEYPIVGLGVVNQTLVICTTGFPMTGAGVNPLSFTTAKLTNFEPCVARGSIVSAPEGVYYASPNGFIRVNPGQSTNITRDLLTKDKWQQLVAFTVLRAARFGTALYAFGAARVGIFDLGSFEHTAFEQADLTGSLNGVLLDLVSQSVAFNLLTTTDTTINVFNDPWSGNVFIIRNNTVYWIDQADAAPVITPYMWRSKIFQLNNKDNFGAMKVYFEVPAGSPTLNPTRNTNLTQTLAADQYALVRIYADGVLVLTRELRTSGELWKLPSGFKADFWQLEVEGRVKVLSMQVAATTKELRSI